MTSENESELVRRALSFRYAFQGCWYVLKTQRNAWIHATISILVVGLGLWLSLPLIDWALIILSMTVVWVAEFMNTALEAAVDLFGPEPNPLAETAKDVAAGAVLVGAVGAAAVGLIILGPPLFDRLF